MSNNLKWAIVVGVGLLAGAIGYVVTRGDVILSLAVLLVAVSIGRFVAHPGSA